MLRVRPQFCSPAALLCGIAVVLIVVLFGRIPGEGRWATDLDNFAHGPAFAIVTLALNGLLRQSTARQYNVRRDYILVTTFTLLLGALVELLQLLIGHDASIDDLRRDAIGIAGAAAFLAIFDRRLHSLSRGRMVQRMSILVAIACSALLVAPLVVTAGAYLERERNFPTLVDFGSPLSTYFLAAYAAATVERTALPGSVTGPAAGTIGLRVSLGGGDRWGLAVWEPKPDWRGFTSLKFDIANPTGDQLVLRVRVRDRHPRRERAQRNIGTIKIAPHTRETAALALPSGATIDQDPYIDLEGVRALVLARSSENRARTFYVVKVWLE